ncbi:hypothetical protein Z043_107195, partial [Scleropages formosus]
KEELLEGLSLSAQLGEEEIRPVEEKVQDDTLSVEEEIQEDAVSMEDALPSEEEVQDEFAPLGEEVQEEARPEEEKGLEDQATLTKERTAEHLQKEPFPEEAEIGIQRN